jgi:hypothetical protein
MSDTFAAEANERSATSPPHKHYLTPKQVCLRYGGRSKMWLWRRRKNDPAFPQPDVMGLYANDELDAYDLAQKAAFRIRNEEAA